jgi:flavin reductase (DIM6/NTAB) family NADH-FMN oxidoreductase RutF
MKSFFARDLEDLSKNVRAQFVNSLAGPRSAYLVGTQDAAGQSNLSIVSSCVHLGSNPALLAMVIRPRLAPRHTYDNILETKYWTLNNVTKAIVKKAHQTSARYAKEVSEFEAVGLTAQWRQNFLAPYVAESTLQIGLILKESIHLSVNNTEFLIGEVSEWHTDERAMAVDGDLDLEHLGSLSVTGLDSYHELKSLFRLSYAKVDQALSELDRPR